MDRIARGAVSGLLATVPMTVVFLAGRRLLHPTRSVPPERITQESGLADDPSRTRFRAKWLGLHLVYGGLLGIGYLWLRPLLPAEPNRAGLAYGEAVWGLHYLGLMPLLRLYPSPPDDSQARTAVNITAHAVYGLALSQAERILD